MLRVIAAFVKEVVVSGRCSVHVGYYVSLLVVAMEYSKAIARVCGGANEVIALNTVRSSCFRRIFRFYFVISYHASYSRQPH